MDFNRYASEGNEFLHQLAKEMGSPDDRDRAAQLFRAVVHTLRDIIPIRESLQLLSQLPLFLKGVYVDGWTDRSRERIRHMKDFLQYLRTRQVQSVLQSMDDEELERLVPVVFLVLRKYVSLGEMEDIKAVLPKELKHLVDPVSMM